ncbi:MAG: hypothetical protein GXN98_02480 [Euryarchaeota archaeon]|nr:hypothetical protein [Euryarchaeota archaeon]
MKVMLYADAGAELEQVHELLEGIGIRAELRGEFLRRFAASPEECARRLASLRTGMPCSDTPREPLYGEVEYERRVLEGRCTPKGVLYHALLLQSYLRSLLPRSEARLDRVHVVLTERLIATCDARIPHLRVVVLGMPGIVSVSGAVEAPARSREYHLARALLSEAAAELVAGEWLRHGDERLARALASYVMQVVFYAAFGEAFCSSDECMLHDSRWQHQVVRAQLGMSLCRRHGEMLERLRNALH